MPSLGVGEYENKSDEWATPKSLVRPLSDAVGGFDLDPASGAERTPHAPNVYTKEDDGLTQQWFGNVFVNPPFSDKVKWIEKAMSEVNGGNADLVVMVLPVDTSTAWYHDLVTQAPVVCFVGPGRMDFDRRSQGHVNEGNPSFAVMLVAFGDRIPAELLGFFGTRGVVYYHRALHQESQQVRFTPGGEPR